MDRIVLFEMSSIYTMLCLPFLQPLPKPLPSGSGNKALVSLHPFTTSSTTLSGQAQTLSFLENQISRCLSLQSTLEYRHWTCTYVQHLVKEDKEVRLREFVSEFVRQQQQSVRCVLGLQHSFLAKEFLSLIASSTKMQRL